VVYRGLLPSRGLVILPAGQKHAWRGEWSCAYCVACLAWSAPGTGRVSRAGGPRAVCPLACFGASELGCNPFLRSTTGGTFSAPPGHRCVSPVDHVGGLPQAGHALAGPGTAFARQPRRPGSVPGWPAGKRAIKDPWLILTEIWPRKPVMRRGYGIAGLDCSKASAPPNGADGHGTARG